MLRVSKHRPSQPALTGFTLIELMFVVLIIGILAAAVAPELNRARADTEVANAALALVRLGSRAHADASYTQSAQLLVWIPVNGNGTVQLFRGTGPRCNSVPWNTNTPIDQVSADIVRYRQGAQLRLLPSPGTPANVEICVQPNGTTMLRASNAVPFTDFLGGGLAAVGFDIFQEIGGAPVGIVRQVVFPNGNIPRWVK